MTNQQNVLQNVAGNAINVVAATVDHAINVVQATGDEVAHTAIGVVTVGDTTFDTVMSEIKSTAHRLESLLRLAATVGVVPSPAPSPIDPNATVSAPTS